MNYKKLIAIGLLLPCLAFSVAGSETAAVAYLEEGSSFLADMTTSPLSEFSAAPVDVTAEYQENAPRGYAFRLDLAGITADQAMEAITAAAPDWLAVTYPAPEGDPVSLEAAGYASLEEAQTAGYSRFYLDIGGFWGLDGGWLPIESTETLRDTAMTSGMLEYYVNPSYLYRTYLAPGTAYDRWQGEFLGLYPENIGDGTPAILKTGAQQLVVFTAGPTAPSALSLYLSGITLDWGPYRAAEQENGEILLVRNEAYAGPRGQDWPDAITCRKTA